MKSSISIETKVAMTLASAFTALTMCVIAQGQAGGPNNSTPSPQGYNSSVPGRTGDETETATTPKKANKSKNLNEKASTDRAPNQNGQAVRPNKRANDQETSRSSEREGARTNEQQNVGPNEREGATINEQQNVRPNEREGTRVQERGGTVSQSTTVFRNGQETNEHIALHRSFRARNDVHFGIGTHPRDWWLRSYTIVLMDGCHYYLADDGCWYPAYGFDPSCNYSAGVIYCE